MGGGSEKLERAKKKTRGRGRGGGEGASPHIVLHARQMRVKCAQTECTARRRPSKRSDSVSTKCLEIECNLDGHCSGLYIVFS